MRLRGTIRIAGVCLLLMALAPAQQAGADLILSDPSLIPTGGTFEADLLSQVASYQPADFEVTEIRLTGFTTVVWTPSGADEVLSCDVMMTGLLTKILGNPASLPVTLNGPMTAIAYGKAGLQTGTWQAEITAAQCTGSIMGATGILIENPGLPSMGVLTITDIGGGKFAVDSFFDIFTKLSVDGGLSFMADSYGPTHLVLIPEPATLALLAAGLPLLLRRKRRQR